MNISEIQFQPSDSAAEAIKRSASILSSVGVDPTQIAIWLLRQHSKFDAAYSNVYDDACELVEWLKTQPQLEQVTDRPVAASTITLTATQVGQMLAEQYADIVRTPSAQQVNQAIEQLGFHRRNDKKGWELTKLGQQYGQIINVIDEQDRTRLQVRWLPTVIDLLAPLFSVS